MNTVAYPMFAATLAKNPEALALANDLDPAAGEYMRPALEALKHLIGNGCIDLGECDKIEDNYSKVILRFFEGDVPMMICTGDTVSGTKKRESQSDAFTKAPFQYSFLPMHSHYRHERKRFCGRYSRRKGSGNERTYRKAH